MNSFGHPSRLFSRRSSSTQRQEQLASAGPARYLPYTVHPPAHESQPTAIEIEIEDRSCVKGEHLAEDKSSDDRYPQRSSYFRPDSCPQCQRQCPQKGGHGGHYDGPEAEQTSLINSVERIFAFAALRFQRKIDHQDRVFFHDADQ